MKKIVFLSLVILVSSSVVWAQEKVDASTLNIGDQWRYRGKSGNEWTEEVTAIEKDIYVIRQGKKLQGYDKLTLNLSYIIEDGKKIKYTDFHAKFLNFPLSVGKTWSGIVRTNPRAANREINFMEEYVVSSFEDVKVLAGTFKTFRIGYKVKRMEGKGSYEGNGILWYSPEVKWVIKWNEENIARKIDFELVSYSLK